MEEKKLFESFLLEVLKLNPHLSLSYDVKSNNWALCGEEFRDITIPEHLAELGYISTSNGICCQLEDNKVEYLAMYCIQ